MYKRRVYIKEFFCQAFFTHKLILKYPKHSIKKPQPKLWKKVAQMENADPTSARKLIYSRRSPVYTHTNLRREKIGCTKEEYIQKSFFVKHF